MKKIEATIEPAAFDALKESLMEVGIRGLTVSEIQGSGGPYDAHQERYRGAQYTVDFRPKLKVEVAVDESEASRVVDTFTTSARAAQNGAASVLVSSIEQATRIRTGQRGRDAL